MTIERAIELLIEKQPGYIPVGYWIRGDEIVIQTKPIKSLRGLTSPWQFAVTPKGEVYGTNPVRHNLDKKDLIKLSKIRKK